MRQCLFIWIPRTAGTSIWTALPGSKQEFRFDSAGTPCNHKRDYKPQFDPDVACTTFCHSHIRQVVRRGVISAEWLSEQLTFAFVRNPWDRLLSLYTYFQGHSSLHEGVGEFSAFVRNVCSGVDLLGVQNYRGWSMANPQVRWLAIVPNFIGRYERLDTDWVQLCELLEIPLLQLPQANKTDHLPYREAYNATTAAMVGEFYKDDCKAFGYEW